MKKFGHYEVTAELGRGGMGVVYQGWEPSLNRKVAIKALGEHLLNDEDLVERFTREAKATAALNDPNVIQIYYIGKEQGQPFFAMEYIEGQSLDDILKGGNSLSVKHAKNILKQACLGLAAAHKIDLVHRDIKPANIMLSTDGTLKIVDFGIARTREYGDKLTNTGEFVGTPGYLSPEVCIGKEVDQRSDIFSLGIVFYEMLAGKVPFENDSPLGLMLEVVQSKIPDIRELNKKVDKKTSYILNKMIAKSPDERYQTCNDIIKDLGSVVENENIATIKDNAKTVKVTVVQPKISEQITLPSAAAVTANNLMVQQKPKGDKKWLVAATLFAVIGAAAFGYYNGYLPIPKSGGDKQISTIADGNAMQAGGVGDSTLIETKEQNNDTNADEPSLIANEKNSKTEKPDELLASLDNNDTNTGTSKSTADSTETGQMQPEQTATGIPSTSSSNIELPEQADQNTIADNTVIENTHIAESKNQLPTIATGSSQIIAQSIKKEPLIVIPPPVALNKGVVVIAFGDPAIANPVEKIIEGELKQQGIKVMNEQFIPGMRQLMNNGLDLAELKRLIEKNGGQVMVIANVNYIGSQELQYAGRYSELISAQLDVDTYDIKTGDSIGNGFGTKINYTSLNATDQASDAVMQFTDRLASSLKNKI
ncbi:MAG: serine/threonine protein kinase [Alcanivoracaceae bacterium]|nr:serine/threonine protein kinase [Alcanivoracaceae bacterium]